jgi:hypothetical protein
MIFAESKENMNFEPSALPLKKPLDSFMFMRLEKTNNGAIYQLKYAFHSINREKIVNK